MDGTYGHVGIKKSPAILLGDGEGVRDIGAGLVLAVVVVANDPNTSSIGLCRRTSVTELSSRSRRIHTRLVVPLLPRSDEVHGGLVHLGGFTLGSDARDAQQGGEESLVADGSHDVVSNMLICVFLGVVSFRSEMGQSVYWESAMNGDDLLKE